MADSPDFKDEIDALQKVLTAVSKLPENGQRFVLQTAAGRLNIVLSGVPNPSATGNGSGGGTLAAGGGGLEAGGDSSGAQKINEKHFIAQKKPQTDIEKVACLAYILTHSKNTPHFKTADITATNTDAASTAFSNCSQALINAQTANYVAKAGKRGNKQITALGEKIVEALPDREAVRVVLEANKTRGGKRKPGKKKAAKKAAKKASK